MDRREADQVSLDVGVDAEHVLELVYLAQIPWETTTAVQPERYPARLEPEELADAVDFAGVVDQEVEGIEVEAGSHESFLDAFPLLDVLRHLLFDAVDITVEHLVAVVAALLGEAQDRHQHIIPGRGDAEPQAMWLATGFARKFETGRDPLVGVRFPDDHEVVAVDHELLTDQAVRPGAVWALGERQLVATPDLVGRFLRLLLEQLADELEHVVISLVVTSVARIWLRSCLCLVQPQSHIRVLELNLGELTIILTFPTRHKTH